MHGDEAEILKIIVNSFVLFRLSLIYPIDTSLSIAIKLFKKYDVEKYTKPAVLHRFNIVFKNITTGCVH